MGAERGRYTVEVERSEALAAAWRAKAAEGTVKAPESDAAAPAEVAEPPSPPPASAPKAEHAAYVADALGVPEGEAAAMKKADLVELARQAAGG